MQRKGAIDDKSGSGDGVVDEEVHESQVVRNGRQGKKDVVINETKPGKELLSSLERDQANAADSIEDLSPNSGSKKSDEPLKELTPMSEEKSTGGKEQYADEVARNTSKDHKEKKLGKDSTIPFHPRAEKRYRSVDEELGSSKQIGKASKRARHGGSLTLSGLYDNPLMQLAEMNWLSNDHDTAEQVPKDYNPDLIQKIYDEELCAKESGASNSLILLEISQYLERYLWPSLDTKTASPAHLLSIVYLMNEKFRQGVSAWDVVAKSPAKFKTFFRRLLALHGEYCFSNEESMSLLEFLDNSFQSLENVSVRKEVLRLVGLPLWNALSSGRLELELHSNPQLRKHWDKIKSKEAKIEQTFAQKDPLSVITRPEAKFLPSLLSDFFDKLGNTVTDNSTVKMDLVRYCERFVRFLTELLSQLPTRRFTHALIDDKAVISRCQLSELYQHSSGKIFAALVLNLRSVIDFPVSDHTGDALSDDDVCALHYQRVQQLQRLFYKHWPALRNAALANCGTLQERSYLADILRKLKPEEIKLLVVHQLRLIDESLAENESTDVLKESMIASYVRKPSMKDILDEMPLYPTETVLMDTDAVPEDTGYGVTGGAQGGALTLPRLNMQFLTLSDYLLRNFHLFRMEAAFEVREDIADAIRRMDPRITDEGFVRFFGWSRMAEQLENFAIVEIQRPRIGENCPAAVVAEIKFDTKQMRPEIQAEWDELKQHDVIFLLSLCPDLATNDKSQALVRSSAINCFKKSGLQFIRGCEIIEIRDEKNNLMNDFTGRVLPEERGPPSGTKRTVVVSLDPVQYVTDSEAQSKVYESFNLIVRRKAKENNFKSVLESIRDLIRNLDTSNALPEWLHDVILGYGDPNAAQFLKMESKCNHTIDFKDTFLDAQHLKDSFPSYKVLFDVENPRPPFKADFTTFEPMEKLFTRDSAVKDEKNHSSDPMETKAIDKPVLHVRSYVPPDPGPYKEDIPPLNRVRFTPVQAAAILSGVQSGLTLVVGPPGTGKTDTAVQILHLLYHNYPHQRTLIITHSNQALNDIFQKITERDIPSRYLLRLGMGEADLDTEETFSRIGRVNAMLERRIQLLVEVQRLAHSLKVGENTEYTCESASYFWLIHVLARWERFADSAKKKGTPDSVADLFPFNSFFEDAPAPLFKKQNFEEDWRKALGCFRHLQRIFQELEELRPFEILKTQSDRINYLLTKQAKIVAMTCTYAALKRKELLQLGFTYDNLVMEEAAQVLEIETALPLLLQNTEDSASLLKRVILIGDHHQLPPVVKNTALQRFSHMDQSLFLRLIRLGTPYIELNAQGRARPSIASLYNWRYKALGDLPFTASSTIFNLANPGFSFEYQLIDVPDFLGRGESEPVQYFYQNLGEAEYVVSLYQYMRLLGYPAHKISILTTYNGQKALLQDVIDRRCADPIFGRPRAVATVDKYQGQQNDYVLLSLVRTKHFGHIRDVRRLIVAMSRARLGLYIFARASLFANCYELEPVFKKLLQYPVKLHLTPGERYGKCERSIGQESNSLVVDGVEHMASIIQSMATDV